MHERKCISNKEKGLQLGLGEKINLFALQTLAKCGFVTSVAVSSVCRLWLPSGRRPCRRFTTSASSRSFEQTEQFASLLTRNQRRIYLFILACCESRDAEEVLQETSIVLWRKFDQFKGDTDF